MLLLRQALRQAQETSQDKPWHLHRLEPGLRTMTLVTDTPPQVTKHYYAPSLGSGLSNGQRIATRVGDDLYYILGDHLGSTTLVVDAEGNEVGRVLYDPYGEIVESSLPPGLTEQLFTGQTLDPSTGLYYYNARYYDPFTASFTQMDTLVADPLNPRAWNRSSYVYGNPVNYTDSSGHFIDTVWDAVNLYVDVRDCLGDSDALACYMAAADIAFIMVPIATGGGAAARVAMEVDDAGDAARVARGFNDEEQIARIYASLRSTEAGEQIYRTASKHGLPTVIFDDALEVGHWGYYDKELNLIGLNPVYRSSPAELGASTLGHELAHRTARWFSGSQSNEFFAHMVEARIWRELQGRIIMPSRFTGAQIRALRSHNEILALANASRDGSALMRYTKNHPRYGRYPISSKNLWKEPLWNFLTRPRGL